MNREMLTRLQSLRRSGEPVAVVTRLSDGEQALVTRGGCEGALRVDPEVVESARERIREDRSGRLENRHEDLFVRVYNRPLRLILTGAVHISQALVPIATILGFEVIVIDPRTAFATDERFPSVKLITDWPDTAMRNLKPDSRTAVVTLTHDPKIDDPALRVALASDAFFVGALGSRRTHAARVDRLRAAGVADADIARVHAPVGVPLGGRRPAEIALSVMAEIIRTLRTGDAA